MAATELNFHGGYEINDTITISLHIDGQSYWLREGMTAAGVNVVSIAPDLAEVTVEVDGEEIIVPIAEAARLKDKAVEVQAPTLSHLSEESSPLADSLRASLSQSEHLTEAQIDVMVMDAVRQMQASPLTQYTDVHGSYANANMQELAEAEALMGNLLLWREDETGKVTHAQTVAWPTNLVQSPETGEWTVEPVSEAEAYAAFAEFTDTFNAGG